MPDDRGQRIQAKRKKKKITHNPAPLTFWLIQLLKTFVNNLADKIPNFYIKRE